MIKPLIMILLQLLPGTAFGVLAAGGSDLEAPDTGRQIQQFQTCIERLDLSALETIDRRSMTVEEEIQSLCARGKIDAARKKAVSWAREAAAAPVVREMIRCGEIMKDRVPDLPFMGLDEDYAGRHVCDME